MPRRHPIDPREKQIGVRLREFRESRGITRIALAGELGVKPSTLRSYEDGRVPLRFDVADRLCQLYDISQEWLANGSGEQSGYLDITALTLSRIKENASFSMGFLIHLQREFLKRDRIKEHFEAKGIHAKYGSGKAYELEGVTPDVAAENEGLSYIQGFSGVLPPQMRKDYFATLMRCADDYIRRHTIAIWDDKLKEMVEKTTGVIPSDSDRTNTVEVRKLDTTPGSIYSSGTAMKNLWLPWQKRLAKVCKPEGMRARLAREFKVSRQAASNWVSGVSEPTAGYALHLIDWIRAEEVKGKT